MLNVFSITNAFFQTGGTPTTDQLPAIAQSNTPVGPLQDLLLVFSVSTLTGTSPSLQVIVEQFVAGQWVAVPGGAQTAVTATGLYTYIIRGGFTQPWRIRVVPGGTTITAASFTLSKWAAAMAA